jgi:4a-hydroxytetrahydrobiopterin dehydratase
VTRLSDPDVAAGLRDLPEWQREGDEIVREFRFEAFMDAVNFVNAVAQRAEAANHHPDIDIRYNRVRIALSTHSAGGITSKDLDLAREVDGCAAPS